MKKMKILFWGLIVCGLSVFGEPVKSMLAADSIETMDAWENPYITDGLVAMWDGEWNAGFGSYDPEATIWADLSGNGNDLYLDSADYVFDSDRIVIYPNSTVTSGKTADVKSIEVVMSISKSNPLVVGRLIHTGKESAGVAIRYRWLLWTAFNNLGMGSKIGSDDAFPFSSYHLHNWMFYQNGNLLSVTSSNATLADMGEIGITTDQYVTLHIRSIRMYSRELSVEEIEYNYSIDRERFNLP